MNIWAELVSGRRSKASHNRLDATTADRTIAISRERYADFDPTLACEKLAECHGVMLGTGNRAALDA